MLFNTSILIFVMRNL